MQSIAPYGRNYFFCKTRCTKIDAAGHNSNEAAGDQPRVRAKRAGGMPTNRANAAPKVTALA